MLVGCRGAGRVVSAAAVEAAAGIVAAEAEVVAALGIVAAAVEVAAVVPDIAEAAAAGVGCRGLLVGEDLPTVWGQPVEVFGGRVPGWFGGKPGMGQRRQPS